MAKTLSNHYAIILCGGTGPRLWPLSRVDHPKQFLKLFSENSILKESFLRVKRIIPAENIYVISNQKYASLIRQDLKGLVKEENIISESEKKNTAMAILYASAIIYQQNSKAVVTSFPSDHFISHLTNFDKDIKKAAKLAQSDSIVTIGIKPNSPSTSFGYIVLDSKDKERVKTFIEKPNLGEAKKLISQNNCFWNSGIYTFKIDTLVSEFQQYSPSYIPLYRKLLENINHPQVIKKIYSLSPSLPIDTAISEKSKKMKMIPASFTWNDVGEWKSIYQELPKTGSNLALLSKDQKIVEINSKNCLISGQSEKLIGLVDVENLAIIDTPDALLVCNIATDGSFRVRDLVTKIVSSLKIKHFFTGKND